jgi:hypothetical protein
MVTTLLKLSGLIGNILFGVAAWPTAWRTLRTGKSVGTPISLAWTIEIACFTFYAYVLGTYGADPMVLSTFFTETTAWTIILWYHYRPRG